VRFHLGIDDTDSLKGGCTTKIATDLVLTLIKKGVSFLDHPNLIRLNPNVPWKTRGNGAICIRIESDLGSQTLLRLAMEEIERNSRLGDAETDPGVVLLSGEIPPEVLRFSREALTRIVTLDEAVSVIKKAKAEAIGYGSAQGLIGALASIGTLFDHDYTFELIAYRSRDYLGKPRLVGRDSVLRMSEEMKRCTFNNVDPETGRVLITPRGLDPILCGVRGESPDAVRKAFGMLQIREPVDSWMIFRTNQGTDGHLIRKLAVSELEDNCAVVLEGKVNDRPRTIRGGHVFFTLNDGTGSVHCAAYEPTGRFRDIVRDLKLGDRVRMFGGVRPASNEIPRTINLEKLEILELATSTTSRNPLCPKCGKRMKSAGKGQGFRCRQCKSHEFSKVHSEVQRDLQEGVYLPPPRAHRHLTKPDVRYGREHSEVAAPPSCDWHFP